MLNLCEVWAFVDWLTSVSAFFINGLHNEVTQIVQQSAPCLGEFAWYLQANWLNHLLDKPSSTG